jgi:hypothetical protein
LVRAGDLRVDIWPEPGANLPGIAAYTVARRNHACTRSGARPRGMGASFFGLQWSNFFERLRVSDEL